MLQKKMERKESGKKRSRVAKLLASLTLAALCLVYPCMKLQAEAVATLNSEYWGWNMFISAYFEGQRYANWASPVLSYLTYDGTQLMSVQAGIYDLEGILVEYYNLKFERQSVRIIPEELPLFGGFYAMDDGYYLVTGQENPSESEDVEVIRVTKYDKDWNRIDSAGLYGHNTVVPFDAGSLRMDSAGKYLVIRTCHEMYRSSDGYNHQANVTLLVDTERMEITDTQTGISNNTTGYVSHSFNQFVKVEDNHIVALDHGDAYPRSILLTEYPTDISTGKFNVAWPQTCVSTNVISFPGAVGYNVTGAAVGGLEISDSSYLVVGTSVVQDDQNTVRRTRNAFLAAVRKDTHEVTVKWLTNVSEYKSMVATTNEMESKEGILWETDTQTVRYKTVPADGDNQLRVYAVNK